jgi:uncharacterized membrane protein YeaQ/YmgE (transglycosylase-associated protein family)
MGDGAGQYRVPGKPVGSQGGSLVAISPASENFLGGFVHMLGILGWIVFGLIAGVIAKLIMPGKDPGGFIVTILLGIAGAFMGGFLGQALGLYNEGEPAGMLMAIVGAILLLAIYRMAFGRRSAGRV